MVTKQEIFVKYPNMFRGCYGMYIGDGWLVLIDIFCNMYPTAKIAQIKEKFGGLRLYLHGENEREVFDTIRLLENLSLRMCEKCGKNASPLTYDGWIKTVCEDHKE